MRILAIDPGSEKSAIVTLDQGAPLDASIVPNAELVGLLRYGWATDPPLLAVEMIASYGMSVGREVFETCLWIGRFTEAWASKGRPFRLIYRREVKLHLCGSNRATDSDIRQCLIDRYGPGKDRAIGKKASPGPLYRIKADEWSALAVAITAEETTATEERRTA